MSGELRVLAAQVVDGGAGGLGFFLPLIAMFLLLYALVIRPQQRQQKEHRQMLTKVEKDDRIVFAGGIHGRVIGAANDVLTVEIAERVRVKIDRAAVTRRLTAAAEPEKPEKSEKPEKAPARPEKPEKKP